MNERMADVVRSYQYPTAIEYRVEALPVLQVGFVAVGPRCADVRILYSGWINGTRTGDLAPIIDTAYDRVRGHPALPGRSTPLRCR